MEEITKLNKHGNKYILKDKRFKIQNMTLGMEQYLGQ